MGEVNLLCANEVISKGWVTNARALFRLEGHALETFADVAFPVEARESSIEEKVIRPEQLAVVRPLAPDDFIDEQRE